MAQGARRDFFDGAGGMTVGASRREPMSVFEVAEVRRFMARTRCGWQAAADFAGRDRHSVRMACDTDYAVRCGATGSGFGVAGLVAVARPAEAVAPPARPEVPQDVRRATFGRPTADSRISRTLAALKVEPLDAVVLGLRLGIEASDANSLLQGLKGEGWAWCDRPKGSRRNIWSLTPAGEVEAAKRVAMGAAAPARVIEPVSAAKVKVRCGPPSGTAGERTARRLDVELRVLERLAGGGASAVQLGQAVALSSQAVAYHLARMKNRQGWLAFTTLGEGRAGAWTLTEVGRAELARRHAAEGVA